MVNQHHTLEKPKNVVLAVQFLWVSLLIGIINTAFNWDTMTAEAHKTFPPNFPISLTTFILIVQGITLGFVVWLFLKVSSGRNWARILLTIFTIIGVLAGIPNLIVYFYLAHSMFFLQLITLLLNVAAVGLLWTKPASAWYKKLKALRKQKAA